MRTLRLVWYKNRQWIKSKCSPYEIRGKYSQKQPHTALALLYPRVATRATVNAIKLRNNHIKINA